MTGTPGEITPENAIMKHLTWIALEGKASTTLESRHGALHRAQAAISSPLADATADQLLTWRLALAGHADTYILAQVSHIRCFCAWLTEHGYRDTDPAARLPVPHKPFLLPHPISEADLIAALDCAPARIRLWIVLAAWAGLRACEIAPLLRRNIRERHDPPHIFIAAGATKGHRERTVPLSAFVLAEIALAGLPLTGACFRRLDDRPGHVSPHRVSALCNDYLHGLGYPDTFHSLRHRFATQSLRGSGGNIRVVQELLGHARLDTTAIYTLVDNPEAAAAVAAIPAPRRLRRASLTSGDLSECAA